MIYFLLFGVCFEFLSFLSPTCTVWGGACSATPPYRLALVTSLHGRGSGPRAREHWGSVARVLGVCVGVYACVCVGEEGSTVLWGCDSDVLWTFV